MPYLEVALRDFAHPIPAYRGPLVGAIHAASQPPVPKRPQAVAKPIRKRPCCKTCKGESCVGRCKF